MVRRRERGGVEIERDLAQVRRASGLAEHAVGEGVPAEA
jgi:hypothetical protein